MPKKITELTLQETLADADIVPFVDKSDTAQSPEGSTRKFSLLGLFNWLKTKFGTAAQKNTGTGLSDVPTGQDLADENYLKFSGGSGLQNTNGTPGEATDFPVEEGTWTPVLEGSITAGSHSYSTQAATYREYGNGFYIDGVIVVSSYDAAADGQALIAGLPFPTASNRASLSIADGKPATAPANYTTLTGRVGVISSNTIQMRYSTSAGGNASLLVDNFGAGTLVFSAFIPK